ncbi:putative colanic acid biosynthesis acetyltransferase [Gramella lutea]|uniref:Colanic acid biosynthesis acetyltransferase n=1 Tax=Christiangramia lutea TaxID=1607951 RepID=A0A9X1V271_9FLAO|nr:putative colanic acid biosynthesis acetyltransferase [Christiangramia lutea]
MNKISRVIWGITYLIFFLPFFPNFCRIWRCFILRLFGAKIGKQSNIRSTVRIWAPWNLKVGNYSSIAPGTDIYNQGEIEIGDRTIISQKTYLCASTHDYNQATFPLVKKPIKIGNQVWIAADAFIGPGVQIGEGVIVGARSAVFKNIEPWTIVRGNPARFVKSRTHQLNGSAKIINQKIKVKDPDSDPEI